MTEKEELILTTRKISHYSQVAYQLLTVLCSIGLGAAALSISLQYEIKDSPQCGGSFLRKGLFAAGAFDFITAILGTITTMARVAEVTSLNNNASGINLFNFLSFVVLFLHLPFTVLHRVHTVHVIII